MKLIDYATTRDPPANVVADLRALDPRVEVVWFGLYGMPGHDAKGKDVTVFQPAWMVGHVYPDPEQLRLAIEGIRLFQDAPAPLRRDRRAFLWDLKYHGFHPTLIYPHGELDSGLVNEYRAYRWIKAHLLEEAVARACFDADLERGLEARRAMMAEIAKHDGRDVWKYVWKGRRSIVMTN